MATSSTLSQAQADGRANSRYEARAVAAVSVVAVNQSADVRDGLLIVLYVRRLFNVTAILERV
jgi:hypothetical protein